MAKPEDTDYFAGSHERAILATCTSGSGPTAGEAAECSLAELTELAEAAGAEVVAAIQQHRQSPDPAWFIGKGKLEEMIEAAKALDATLIIFDDELSGSQIRNIEEFTNLKVIDRTFLILDIFARRALTSEGKLQVELAQLQYRLSRLVGTRQALSRLGGGIGTRGPGETQLETDRRHINRRILYLKKALRDISERRDRTRRQRKESNTVIAAVVGYTNAGKTSLLNALCKTDLLAMDQVFATLDPTARQLMLPDGQTLVLVDTVGFIRRLPHHLVDAFRSTLAEVVQADMIIQVTDVSDPDYEQQMDVVEALLVQLESADKPRIHALNKVDLLGRAVEPILLAKRSDRPDRQNIAISARTGKGLAELQDALSDLIALRQVPVHILLPYDQAGLLDYVRRFGTIVTLEYKNDGIYATIRIKASHLQPLRPWLRLAENPAEQ